MGFYQENIGLPHEVPQETKDMKLLFQRVFGSSEGQKVLSELTRWVHDMPSLPFTGIDGVTLQVAMAIREGNRDFLRRIKVMLASEKG